ncbi:hypothetical protein K435DRAFT_846261 [Dendrothele bispora CBS 962.96]|uniref:Uncharacterized protein n=1 Tax=Dendrothele bispora (strain CBS 962.96) TaxID=1314807 RepID=A0A4S8KNM5_DENBC|nr:hypothetical protein K435DRAFT_846261 [Dendrothele bispora CBS 962.96]
MPGQVFCLLLMQLSCYLRTTRSHAELLLYRLRRGILQLGLDYPLPPPSLLLLAEGPQLLLLLFLLHGLSYLSWVYRPADWSFEGFTIVTWHASPRRHHQSSSNELSYWSCSYLL